MSALKENPMVTKILSCFKLACLLALSLFADRCLAQEPAEKPNSDMPNIIVILACLLYTSPSPRDRTRSRMPSSA